MTIVAALTQESASHQTDASTLFCVMPTADRLIASTRVALEQITAQLPGGQQREGQVAMAEAIAEGISLSTHVVVEAGTGTGKTFAYLVPAIVSGRRTVVATATKTLQDQLANKDLPFLTEHLGRDFSYAVLKGRSNYLCLQRLGEAISGDAQLELVPTPSRAQLTEIVEWASQTETGDRAELTNEPSHFVWSSVSVGPRECPGAAKCPKGEVCFAEKARQRASDADIVVVNLHLYGINLATDGAILPEHEVVIIDEAHQFEDIMAASAGVELTPGRFTNMARTVAAILSDDQIRQSLDDLAERWRELLDGQQGRRFRQRLDDDMRDFLSLSRGRMDEALAALRNVPTKDSADVEARRLRAVQAVTSLIEDVDSLSEFSGDKVVWIENGDPSLRLAPIDVGTILQSALWSKATVVLTSATLPSSIATQLEIPDDNFTQQVVDSPFQFEEQALLYCAAHFPDPRSDTFDARMHEELVRIINAAGGRTLALFTSYRALREALEVVRPQVEFEVLGPDDLTKTALLEKFTNEAQTCLFATMGFWQGVDIPGDSLRVVTIDRIPFPRPDDPLTQARRERAKADGFKLIDLPRASTLLAQGVGRLIRTETDKGVVAVFDPRMANANYRWALVKALPPMKRTKDLNEVEEFLRSLD